MLMMPVQSKESSILSSSSSSCPEAMGPLGRCYVHDHTAPDRPLLGKAKQLLHITSCHRFGQPNYSTPLFRIWLKRKAVRSNRLVAKRLPVMKIRMNKREFGQRQSRLNATKNFSRSSISLLLQPIENLIFNLLCKYIQRQLGTAKWRRLHKYTIVYL